MNAFRWWICCFHRILHCQFVCYILFVLFNRTKGNFVFRSTLGRISNVLRAIMYQSLCVSLLSILDHSRSFSITLFFFTSEWVSVIYCISFRPWFRFSWSIVNTSKGNFHGFFLFFFSFLMVPLIIIQNSRKRGPNKSELRKETHTYVHRAWNTPLAIVQNSEIECFLRSERGDGK